MAEAGARQVMALYRRVLRVHHQKLAGPLRSLGDSYVSEEFRKHLKGSTTAAQWKEFGRQWSEYVDMLSGQADMARRSGDLPEDVLHVLTPEQQQQLAKLQEAALDLGQELVDQKPGDSSGPNQ
eukprot:jgi/Chrzof1/3855/Cz13g11090.t1